MLKHGMLMVKTGNGSNVLLLVNNLLLMKERLNQLVILGQEG